MRPLALIAPLLLISSALAQKPIAPTRADLARAYLRFETELKAHPPTVERIPDINRAFDALTIDFFAGNSAAAIQKLDALTEQLTEGTTDGDESARLVSAIRVAIRPRVFSLVAPTDFTADVRLLYALPPTMSTDSFQFEMMGWTSTGGSGHRPDRTAGVALPKLVPGVVTRVDLGRWIPPTSWRAGENRTIRWQLGREGASEFGQEDALACVGTSSSGVRLSFVPVREAIVAGLESIAADDPPLSQALATCRARALLLDDVESETNSAQFLANMDDLADAIEAEAKALHEGRDPYRRHTGDLWRVVLVGQKELPVRVFAPRRAAGDEKLPLVIALHGAGGDENMFFDGYGAGRIKELAEEKGFLCVAPRVGFTGLSGAAFDAIVQALLYDYAIDVKRIHVIGHSMGAAAAYGLATSRADRLASVACLCGGAAGEPPSACAPLLVVAGELDPLARPEGLKKGAERLAAAGRNVEYRLAPDYGHTLIVGAKLPEVVAWMLAHTR